MRKKLKRLKMSWMMKTMNTKRGNDGKLDATFHSKMLEC